MALSTVAVSGARCSDLATQVARAQLGARPDVAVILVGTNDATHLVRPGEAAAALAAAVRRLRDAGTAVVVGTCPDLGALRAIAPPLRQVIGWYGRRMARAQAAAAEAAGAAVVDLARHRSGRFSGPTRACCATTVPPVGRRLPGDGLRLVPRGRRRRHLASSMKD